MKENKNFFTTSDYYQLNISEQDGKVNFEHYLHNNLKLVIYNRHVIIASPTGSDEVIEKHTIKTFRYSGDLRKKLNYNHSNIYETIFKNEIEDVDLNKIKTLHIHKDSILPRYRLKELKENKNINITRDWKKADHIIFNDDTVERYFNSTTNYTNITHIETLKSLILDIYEKAKSNTMLEHYLYNDTKTVQTFHRSLHGKLNLKLVLDYILETKFDAEYLELPSYVWACMHNITSNVFTDYSTLSEKGYYLSISKTDDIMFLDCLESLSKKPIIRDAKLNAFLGETIIDKGAYEFINNLLKGSTSDIILAMSMMANCNYEKSKFYLTLLFYNNMSKFMSQRSAYYMVSFKSLMSYMEDQRLLNIANYDGLIAALETRDMYNEESKELICNMIKNDLISDKIETICKRAVVSSFEIKLV